jgi:cobalt-zinc-cadmium efflux system protein
MIEAEPIGDTRGMNRLRLALGVTLVFMAVEAAGGVLSGSLALLADAGHMLTDAMALGLAYAAFWLGRRPPDPKRSYGYRRLEVLAAWANGLLLSGVALWVMVEAARRLLHPTPVEPLPMLGVALLGLGANAVTLWLLEPGRHEHIAIRASVLHVVGDLLGSIGAALAAVVILLSGWVAIDPLLSLAIALLILRSAWTVVKDATHILLEGTPETVDPETIRSEIARAVPEVCDIHHIHAWSLTSGSHLLTLHASLTPGADRDQALRAIKQRLETEFRIYHSVIQIEGTPCPDETAARKTRTAAVAGLLLIAAVGAAWFASPALATPGSAPSVTVFAAASLTDALQAIIDTYGKDGRGSVTASFASSSALARQIENGAPADTFLSASSEWMDYLVRRGFIADGTRRVLLRNRLALIVPADRPIALKIAPGFALGAALGSGRLAIGDPDYVPAGIYAKAALVSLGVWDDVAARLAPAADVRAALALVERGEAAAGIVFATDVAASRRIRLVGLFPADSHPPILYEAALVTGARPEARAFLDYLRGPGSRAVFKRFGFETAD